MAELAFGFTQFLRELDSIQKLARRLLDRQTVESVLPMYRSQVENLRVTPRNTGVTFEVPEYDPIRTKVSRGDYEASGRGISVYATISSIWDVVRIQPDRQRDPARAFRLAGRASTRVRLFRVQDDVDTEEIAMWRMEIGDAASPGCHFHVQVLGEADTPPFPSLLPIPRLPSVLFTPAAVLEFVLGELFQGAWTQELLRHEADLHRWAPVQRDRLERLLNWHHEVLQQGPSPWLALKGAKPSGNLFVEQVD